MSKNRSRTANTVRNSSFGIIEYCFTMIASFVVRTVFIHQMAQEYLGFNGLFTNILSMFSLAEMGIGNALGFMLYGSLAAKDEHKTRQIMAFYKKVYIGIALIILAIGLVLMPFIPSLIKEVPNVPESIYLIYFLYLIDSVGTYLMAYQQGIINRDQKSYIISIGTIVSTVVMSVGQILVLFITHNFIAYLIIQFASKLIKNAVLAALSYRMYPYLKNNHEILNPEDKRTIINDTKALLLYRISGIVTSSTDNLIISKFIGLTAVGLYSNYYMITHACYSLIKKGITGISASAGHLYFDGNKDAVERLFSAGTFFAYWIFGYVAAAFFVVLDPFIKIWAGTNFMLDRPTVILIILNFFFMGLTETYGVFRNAFGLFVQGRFRPVASAITNLVLSLIFVQFLGMFGVFLGTLVAYVGFNYWYDPFVIYKHALGKPSKYFWIKSIKYLITVGALIIICVFTALLTTTSFKGIWLFLIRGVEATVIFNVVFVLLYRKSDEYKYIYDKLLSKQLRKIKRKLLRK